MWWERRASLRATDSAARLASMRAATSVQYRWSGELARDPWWPASNSAQRKIGGPWCDRWPGVRLASEEYTVTSSPACRTAWAEEENRRASPRNAHTIAATSGPTPYSSRGQGLAADLAAGERGDLGVHRRQLGLQVIHPAQRDRDRLRAGRGQPDVLAALQHGPRLRIGQPPGQAGHALVEQRGVDPLRPRGVLFLFSSAVWVPKSPPAKVTPGRRRGSRWPADPWRRTA